MRWARAPIGGFPRCGNRSAPRGARPRAPTPLGPRRLSEAVPEADSGGGARAATGGGPDRANLLRRGRPPWRPGPDSTGVTPTPRRPACSERTIARRAAGGASRCARRRGAVRRRRPRRRGERRGRPPDPIEGAQTGGGTDACEGTECVVGAPDPPDRGLAVDDRLFSPRFPRSNAYHPDWVLAGVGGGANPLWLTEWLAEGLDLRPEMRVLDLGCGRGLSSVFLRREFGVRVWATDLWFDPTENLHRARDAGAADGVFPVRADARMLPFPAGFFDAVVSVDSFMYYGTDDLYLNSLARFVRPGGQVGVALAGFLTEIDDPVPAHLAGWWAAEMPYCLHSAGWWRRHWERTGILDVTLADTLPDGWQFWRDWLKLAAPANETEIRAVEADAGRHVGYVRAVGRRRADAQLFDPLMSVPAEYALRPLLRGPG
ncbi:MAG: hypothetical protein C0501_02985 [Isosphaera sp.]|nr:hypothetical protein [Isosphaera sp.]